jgi:hypothetical protein
MRRTKQAIGFQIVMDIDGPDLARRAVRFARLGNLADRYHIAHSFSFKAQSQRLETSFEIVDEHLVISEERGDHVTQLVLVQRQGTEISIESHEPVGVQRRGSRPTPASTIYPFNDENFKSFLASSARADRLLVESFKLNPIIRHCVDSLAQVRVYQLTPLEARKSGTPTPGAALEKHGANLPTMVSDLRRRSGPIWDGVLEAMRRVMPRLLDIDVIYTPDRRMTLQFHEAGVGRPWSVSQAQLRQIAPDRADSIPDAESLLKAAARKPGYNKTRDAVEIMMKADMLRIAENSRSFRRLLRCVNHPRYADQSKEP